MRKCMRGGADCGVTLRCDNWFLAEAAWGRTSAHSKASRQGVSTLPGSPPLVSTGPEALSTASAGDGLAVEGKRGSARHMEHCRHADAQHRPDVPPATQLIALAVLLVALATMAEARYV
jgi:hypothetical protein